MVIRKRLLELGTAAALLLNMSTASAGMDACCDPCGAWVFGAHALYFTPITCPHAYAQVNFAGGAAIARSEAHVVPCDGDWGFRIFGGMENRCTFVGLSYQWLDVTNTNSVTSTNIIIGHGAELPLPGRAVGQEKLEYQNVDVRFGRYVVRGCDFDVYLYGNARWVDLSHRRSLQFVGSVSDVFETLNEKSEIQGGALGIGFGGDFDLFCGLGAFLDGNLLGVIGERSIKDVRQNIQFMQIVASRRVDYPSDTCVIPELNFRIGIDYTYECGCWKLVGELGYEVDYFWHGTAFPDLTGLEITTDNAFFVPVCEDIGFSGLFFGGKLLF